METIKLENKKTKDIGQLVKNIKEYCKDNINDMFYLKLVKFIKDKNNLYKFG